MGDFHYGNSGGLVEEHIRLDRKQLERVMYPEGPLEDLAPDAIDSNNNLSHIVSQLMLDTNTKIGWPDTKGKVNKESSKMQIVGNPGDVALAKARIFNLFAIRKDKVTLKLDISFTDHSHVIGKGGKSIQTVMDETSCHIHFPDSNRTNTYEKSNQVSIAGSAVSAEQARCKVRNLLPVTVTYELALNDSIRTAMDSSNAALQNIQRTYGISVTLRPIFTMSTAHMNNYHPQSGDTMHPGLSSMSLNGSPSLHGFPIIQVSIRGSRSGMSSFKQGISCLLENLSGGYCNIHNTPAIISTEIATQNHSFVAGRSNCNMKLIQQMTGASVYFPDPLPSVFSMARPTASTVPNKKSTVTIKGPNFDSVYKGWSQLLGFLPLSLLFDLKEGQDTDSTLMTQLMESMNVNIIVKPKQKYNTKSVLVRGAEKDSRILFEIRRQILDLDQSEVPYCCHHHYWNNFTDTIAKMIPPPPPPPSSLSTSPHLSSSTNSGTNIFPQNSSSLPLTSSFVKSEPLLAPGIVSLSGNDSFEPNPIPPLPKTHPFLSPLPSIPLNISSSSFNFLSRDHHLSHDSFKVSSPPIDSWMSPLNFRDGHGAGLTRYTHPLMDDFQHQKPERRYTDDFLNTFPLARDWPRPIESIERTNLRDVLIHYNLHRYQDAFEGVSLAQFLSMTSSDLCNMNLPFNARTNILSLIKNLRTKIQTDGFLSSFSSPSSSIPSQYNMF